LSAIKKNAANAAALQAENASLRDRMLRALAEAENTRRRAERAAKDARQDAIADFARQVQDIVPACPVTDVPEQKRGAFVPRFVIRLSSYPRTSEKGGIRRCRIFDF